MKLGSAALAIGALLASNVLVGCGGDDSGSDVDASSFPDGSPMAAIAESGKFRVGIQTTYPLIGQQTLDGYSGFDVELAEELGDRLGIGEDEIEFVPVTTPTREAFIEQDKVDMVIAAYSITEEREKVVDFAGPYYESPSQFMVPAGNSQGIAGIEDMAGKKLCVPSGGIQETTIRADYPDVASGLVLFDSSAKCRDAVLNGSVDASSTDVAILASFVSESDDELEVVEQDPPYVDSFYGIGVKQESDPVFCEWVNEQLAEMFEDGSWEEAYKETLGTVLEETPAAPKPGTCGTLYAG